jgi:leader peptidase (prepilin peptidase) / N-methyltransferase
LAVVGFVGLCVGSFINVVWGRFPRMLNRGQLVGVKEWIEVETAPETASGERLAPRASAAEREALSAQLKDAGKTFDALVAAQPDETLWRPRSRCNQCARQIKAHENIPVLSYALLGGKCAGCGAKIGLRYPIVEAICGLMSVLIVWRLGVNAQGLAGMALFLWLMPAALIDAETTWLPNEFTMPLLWGGLLLNLFAVFVPLREAVIGAMVGYLLLASVSWTYEWLKKIPMAMGRGDFALMAALGAWFGWQAVLPIVFLSAFVGAVVGITLMALGRADAASKIPFGPYIAGAAVVYLLAGPGLAQWFFRLI